MKNRIFKEVLISKLRSASDYNSNYMVKPVAVLWTDKDRQWEKVIPVLRQHLPILTLGDYQPDINTGPAYYLRCMLAGTIEQVSFQAEETSIIYLPGVSKQDIRAIEECPEKLQPIADLQYRGVLWNQKNGRDWTIPAFIQSSYGGLGIEVGGDQDTLDALQRSILKLLDEPIEKLSKSAPLRASFFDSLLTTDEHKNILLWLGNPEEYKLKVTDEEWQAFNNICRSKYDLSPEKDGPLTAAKKLVSIENEWKLVWARFSEAPQNYPEIPGLLRRAAPQQASMEKDQFWPKDNQAAEGDLSHALETIDPSDEISARNRLLELEEKHGDRRGWVWAKLGEAPLANIIGVLAKLAKKIDQQLYGDSILEMLDTYQDWGWEIDDLVLRLMDLASSLDKEQIVLDIIDGIYKPWLREGTQRFQYLVNNGTYDWKPINIQNKGTCFIFVDALRMDIGMRIRNKFLAEGYYSEIKSNLAALPTITGTAKYALFDYRDKLTGKDTEKLTPREKNKKSIITAQAFRDLLIDEGIQVLIGHDLGDPSGIAFHEMGKIDSYGHQYGWMMAKHVDDEINTILSRVKELLSFGWNEVVIITDHGWLLLPSEMRKDNIPEHLTRIRKGRCAELKTGAQTEHMRVPWHWDKNVAVAVAPDISCFEAGKVYEHGGVSVQECVTPVIKIRKGDIVGYMSISEMNWRGLRFTAEIPPPLQEIFIDLRLEPGNPGSSVIDQPIQPDVEGKISILIVDDDLIGEDVMCVVLDSDGNLITQKNTRIGGGV